jgi:4-diphosphocytidyl-2-C-methyl-D-erythritol kinase
MTNCSTTDPVLRTSAPAKLNLCLRVVGRRDDGRHLLESLFWPLDWSDELEAKPGNAISLDVSWAPDAPRPAALASDRTNLAWRAAEAAVAAGGAPAALSLRKRLPAEAGLGGGSSDAAAVLRLLCPAPERARAAAWLGADVPFFLDPRPGWMTGIGDVRDRWDAGALDWGFVVAIPPFPLSTARVFDHFRTRGIPTATSVRPPERPSSEALSAFLATHGNALTPSAVALEPRLGPVLNALEAMAPLHFGMSGSGSACFAIFETLSIAKKKAQVLDANFRSLNCKWIAAGTFRLRGAAIADQASEALDLGEHHGNHRGEGLPGERR